MATEKTSAALRKQFLEEHAFDILNEYALVAKGEKAKFDGSNSIVRAEIWDLTKKLIIAAKDREKLDATTKESVLQLLADGKISITDAKDLIEMLTLDGTNSGATTPSINITVAKGPIPTKESFEEDRKNRLAKKQAELDGAEDS